MRMRSGCNVAGGVRFLSLPAKEAKLAQAVGRVVASALVPSRRRGVQDAQKLEVVQRPAAHAAQLEARSWVSVLRKGSTTGLDCDSESRA